MKAQILEHVGDDQRFPIEQNPGEVGVLADDLAGGIEEPVLGVQGFEEVQDLRMVRGHEPVESIEKNTAGGFPEVVSFVVPVSQIDLLGLVAG